MQEIITLGDAVRRLQEARAVVIDDETVVFAAACLDEVEGDAFFRAVWIFEGLEYECVLNRADNATVGVKDDQLIFREALGGGTEETALVPLYARVQESPV